MLVQDIIDLVKIRTGSIATTKNDKALMKFIYLGVNELCNTFNLLLKSETIAITENISYYELSNPDVSLLLNLYDIEGRQLYSSDVVDGKAWDIKLVNYKSFIVNHPMNTAIYAVYKASPSIYSDVDDIVELPVSMTDALLCYVTYMVHSTITTSVSVLGRNQSTEATDYYTRFKQLCNELEMQGYKVPLNAEMLSIIAKGYV